MGPPDWVYTDSRPKSDNHYFSNLTRCIFQGGLNWEIIANKWPNFIEAFEHFDIEKVAAYDLTQQDRLRNDASIIRNKRKIMATIHNAEEFLRIKKKHGTFQQWLDSLDKSNNYKVVVNRLKTRFKWVGDTTAHIFLWSIGEPIKHDKRIFTKPPKKLV